MAAFFLGHCIDCADGGIDLLEIVGLLSCRTGNIGNHCPYAAEADESLLDDLTGFAHSLDAFSNLSRAAIDERLDILKPIPPLAVPKRELHQPPLRSLYRPLLREQLQHQR